MTKMRRISMVFLTLFVAGSYLTCQETEPVKEEFKPSGSPIVTIFTDFHILKNGDGDLKPGFDVTRAYFGYEYNFSQNWSGKLVFDVGNVGDEDATGYKKVAFPKNALLNYKTGSFSMRFGLIGLNQFSLQEKQWGYRCIYKPFQDAYGMGYSADYGMAADYKFSDLISADASITNGEGFKSLDTDSTLKLSAGVTVSPIKGLDFRMYYDFLNDTAAAQQTISFYGGYKTGDLSFGAEFNYQINNSNAKDNNLYGISLYGRGSIAKNIFGFARFDMLNSTTLDGATDPWNIGDNGQKYIVGVEFNPVKGIRIAPNFQGWSPAAEGADFETGIYLSIEIKI